MRVFVKLGGSFITDKQQESVFRPELVRQFGYELQRVLDENPNLQFLIGHGSGSFGHVAAQRYGTIHGVNTQSDWRGYAKVANVASELNYLVVKVLEEGELPVIRIQPSASMFAAHGHIVSMSTETINILMEAGLIPVIHGDVSLDTERGGTIVSTEGLFFFLAGPLAVEHIYLLGEVDGVYDSGGNVIPLITPNLFAHIESALGGSHGTDVTGGMRAKVVEMLALVKRFPSLSIRIMSGVRPGIFADVVAGRQVLGTLIRGD